MRTVSYRPLFQQVMRSHQQLSLSRVLCPESVVSFSECVISVDVTNAGVNRKFAPASCMLWKLMTQVDN